ncbi:MAG TPA: nitroreductase family deazaflavin-dependent oxidoreductase [Actinomycetota bacterium]|nr:nitroreductase family deazaflavin-dependent oxidoreductase [Actinomycetota bacterium]
MTPDPAAEYCYVTTTGRKSGRPHTIEIWFGLSGSTLYLLSGGGFRSDWVANLHANPRVSVRVGDQEYAADARIVQGGEEEARARRMLAEKYQGWRKGQELSGWATTALVVALDLAPEA